MTGNRKSPAHVWIDPDDASDHSSAEWRAKLAAAPVKRGRPKSIVTKVSTTIRLDADVLHALKSTGAGWQTRANGILRVRLLAKRKPAKRA